MSRNEGAKRCHAKIDKSKKKKWAKNHETTHTHRSIGGFGTVKSKKSAFYPFKSSEREILGQKMKLSVP